jgi:hypothetical protein
MTEPEGISLEHFRMLTERAGLNLSAEELSALKPMYDYYAALLPALHEMELDAEDLAVSFSPGWDPRSQDERP